MHFVVSVVLLFVLVSSAYDFSRHGGAEIGSSDELHRLGPSPQLAIAGLVLCGLADFVVSIIMLAVPDTRSRAWHVPVVGIVLSAVVVGIAVLAFQPAVPYVGG